MTAMRLAVETDLFEHRTVKQHFINDCCFGEDFAVWLIGKLRKSEFVLGEPVQEDYGWGFFATTGKKRYWVAISYVGVGPQEPPPQWVISISPHFGLNPFERLFRRADEESSARLGKCVELAISSEPAIRSVPLP